MAQSQSCPDPYLISLFFFFIYEESTSRNKGVGGIRELGRVNRKYKVYGRSTPEKPRTNHSLYKTCLRFLKQVHTHSTHTHAHTHTHTPRRCTSLDFPPRDDLAPKASTPPGVRTALAISAAPCSARRTALETRRLVNPHL